MMAHRARIAAELEMAGGYSEVYQALWDGYLAELRYEWQFDRMSGLGAHWLIGRVSRETGIA